MKILFICTHNRCRSILAEAIARDAGIIAGSAGSQPEGEVHPLTLRYLAEQGISTLGLRSQSWDEFSHWQADIVITVCDSAAAEACPLWMGDGIKVHWGLPDPSKIENDAEATKMAFESVINTLKTRLKILASTQLQDLSNTDVVALLKEMEGQE